MLLLQINAMANKAAGKGYESTDFYENVKFQFFGIENIHVMRQSLQKMTECKCTWKKIIKTAILVFTFGRLKCMHVLHVLHANCMHVHETWRTCVLVGVQKIRVVCPPSFTRVHVFCIIFCLPSKLGTISSLKKIWEKSNI